MPAERNLFCIQFMPFAVAFSRKTMLTIVLNIPIFHAGVIFFYLNVHVLL